MFNRRLFLIATCLLLTALSARPAIASDPLEPLKYIYANINTGRDKEPFSAGLQELYDAAVKRSEELQEPVSGLDFDYSINGQDYEESTAASVKYEIVSQDDTNAEVKVTFKNFNMHELRYFLANEGGDWLVDDVVSKTPDSEWIYSELLKEGAK